MKIRYLCPKTWWLALQSVIPDGLAEILKNQKYHIIGAHSAVKRCRWLYETLIHNRSCYKQKFYGIRSHQCIQMTPSVFNCTMRCLFCWRAQSGDLKLKWNETEQPKWDASEDIVDGCIKAQHNLLSGYKGNSETDSKKLSEASSPKHVAISLTGESTLYPSLGDLIHGFHKRGFTTFLVSNGTLPNALSELSEEPTQLYISVCAFDEENYLKTCRPQITSAWENLNKTLSLLPSFKCPTVIRITLVRNLNMKHPELYARLLENADPTYVEPKAYMHVGFSRLRLGFENMPPYKEIQDFAAKLAKELGYNVLDESPESRVVLLSHLKKPIKLT